MSTAKPAKSERPSAARGPAKRLPRAVREQQMLDAAVEVFAANGFRDTNMDAIAAKASISKPMLYLYYGSKDDLFAACLDREGRHFIDALSNAFIAHLNPREQVREAISGLLNFVDTHRESWRVLYRVGVEKAEFAERIQASRAQIISLIVDVLRSGTAIPTEDQELYLMAVALVGAGEAMADRIADGDIDLATAVDIMSRIVWNGLSGKRRDDADPTPATDPQ